jgi:hypothetical protein
MAAATAPATHAGDAEGDIALSGPHMQSTVSDIHQYQSRTTPLLCLSRLIQGMIEVSNCWPCANLYMYTI